MISLSLAHPPGPKCGSLGGKGTEFTDQEMREMAFLTTAWSLGMRVLFLITTGLLL